MLAVLTRAYGAFLLTLPWNPYLPVLWWIVFVLAVWSVLADDLAMLPIVVFAGSLCMQTHISYFGLIGGLVLVAAIVVGRTAFERRADAGARRALWRWGGISVATGIVLWIPPVIDQFAHSPGNLGIIRDYSDMQGSMFIDRSLYTARWQDTSVNVARAPAAASGRSQTAPRSSGWPARTLLKNVPVPPPTSSTELTPATGKAAAHMMACRRAPAACASWNASVASGCAATYEKKSVPWATAIGLSPSRTAASSCA